MWCAAFLVVATFIQNVLAVGTFPLKNCTSGDIDVVIHVSSINPLQKVRLKSLVKLFSSDQDELKNKRVALFLAQNLTVPVIEFNNNIKTSKLLSTLETLNYFTEYDAQVVDLVLARTFEYFNHNQLGNYNRLQIVIILCEICTFSTNMEISPQNTLETLHVFIISITEMQVVQWQFQRYINHVFISQTDDLRDNQFLSMALCGQCSSGWFSRSAERTPDLHSCYKIEIFDSLMSYNTANQHCKALQSHVVVIETHEELEDLREELYFSLKKNLSLADVGPHLMAVGLCNVATHQIKMSMPINLLKKQTNEFDSCYALELQFEPTSLNLTWISIDPNEDVTKLVLCEFGMSFRFLRYHRTNPYSTTASNAKNMTFMNEVGPEQNTLLFDCLDLSESVPYCFVDDGYRDCKNGFDESNIINSQQSYPCLNSFICSATGFLSAVRATCVKKTQKCDGILDCPEGEDEVNCNECMETSLSDGTCLPSQWFYDESRRNFSFSRRDKPIDVNKTAMVDKILTNCNTIDCLHNNEIFFEIIKCDAAHDTQIYSEISEQLSDDDNHWSARCVYLRGRYSKKYMGCLGNSHLTQCESFVCTDGLFKCPLSYCVPYYMINDGVIDCPNGDDEIIEDVSQIYSPNFFQCRGSLTLIHPVHVCDGQDHCPTGDDELVCYDKCPEGFNCDWGVISVSDVNRTIFTDFIENIDFNIKAINLAGVNCTRISYKSQANINELVLLRLSQCNLTTDGFYNFSRHLNIYFSHSDLVDLSHNLLSPFSDSDLNSRSFNYSYTTLTSFHLSSMLTKVLDLSSSSLESFEFSLNGKFVLDHLNVSNTSLETFNMQNSRLSVGTLDVRNTKFTYNRKLVTRLENISVSLAVYADSYKMCCRFNASYCFAQTDPISTCYGLLGDVYKRTVSIVVASLGVSGSLVVLAFNMVLGNKEYNEGFKIYATHLCVSDFLMNLYLMCISLTDLYYSDDYVVYDLEWMKSPLCRGCSFLATLSYVSSALFLVLATIDQVLLARRVKNNNTSRFVLVASSNAVWGFCLVLSLVPLVISEWKMPSSNSMCMGLPFFVEHPTGYVFSSLVFVLLVFLCLLACIYMTLKITIQKSVVIKDCKTGQRKVFVLTTLLHALCWLVFCMMFFISALVDGGNVYVMDFKSIFIIPLKSATNPYIFVGPFVYNKWIDFKNGRQGHNN